MSHDDRAKIVRINPIKPGWDDTGSAPVAAPPPPGTPDDWKSAVGGTWATAADWSTGAAPTVSNDATMAGAGSYTVTINSAAAVNSLTINDTGTINSAGGEALIYVDHNYRGETIINTGTINAGVRGGFIAETSCKFANGVLTVKDGTKTEASLHFTGTYTQSDFSLASDGHSGTVITFV